MFPIVLGERISEIAQGLLLISKVRLDDKGKYVCLVNNSAGKDSIHVNLVVTGEFSEFQTCSGENLKIPEKLIVPNVAAPLSVHVQPQNQVIDVNKEAAFVCIIGGFPVSQILWFHNGKPLIKDRRHSFKSSPERLFINPVQKEDHGMYQCFANNEWDMVQSTAELQLGGELS